MLNKEKLAGRNRNDTEVTSISSKAPSPQPRSVESRPGSSLSTAKNNLISEEKAKAFEIFKSGYPAGEWIEGQKKLLKNKYTEAKSLGEKANSCRTRISTSLH
jgi:hypothetical protein